MAPVAPSLADQPALSATSATSAASANPPPGAPAAAHGNHVRHIHFRLDHGEGNDNEDGGYGDDDDDDDEAFAATVQFEIEGGGSLSFTAPIFRFGPDSRALAMQPSSRPTRRSARLANATTQDPHAASTTIGGYQLRDRSRLTQTQATTAYRFLPFLRRTQDRAETGMPGLSDGIAALIVELLMASGFPGAGQHFQGQPPASVRAENGLDIISSPLSHEQTVQSPSCLICMEEFPTDSVKNSLSTDATSSSSSSSARLASKPSAPATAATPATSSTPATTDTIRAMPCHHLFHEGCLFQWLSQSNNCPTCRYEIMTENDDYNRSIRERMAPRDEALSKLASPVVEQPDLAAVASAQPTPQEGPAPKRRRISSEEDRVENPTTSSATETRYPTRSRRRRPQQ